MLCAKTKIADNGALFTSPPGPASPVCAEHTHTHTHTLTHTQNTHTHTRSTHAHPLPPA